VKSRPGGLPAAGGWEWLKRLGFFLFSAVLVARLTWPGEANDELTSLPGVLWVPCLMLAGALSLVGMLFTGRLVWRWSWADLALGVLALIVLTSARHASEPRVAWNLAWEWVGVALAYLFARSMPRTPRKSVWLASVLVAAGTAVAAYGLYQVVEVLPATRQAYRENPDAVLQQAGVGTDPAARRQFEDRLLGSREPTGPYALANTLAGVLLVPTVVTVALALGSWGLGQRGWSIGSVVPLIATLLCCLLLTKSRTAYLGLAVALGYVGWRLRRTATRRVQIAVAALGLLALAMLVTVLVATGQLDRQVLTEARKSLGYRAEYGVGTWHVLADGGAWWRGLGPGNFGARYLHHKLPQASEAISDPHNLFLEAWTTGGLLALLALLAALGLGLANVLRPFGPTSESDLEPESPPSIGLAAVLMSTAAGLGSLALALSLRPDLSSDLMRWIVIIFTFLLSMICLEFCRRPPRAVALGLGAGVLGLCVNLLGAGGIGFAPVALMLWTGLALALDLRGDLGCGRLRETPGRTAPAFLLGAMAALGGVWYGTMSPALSAAAKIGEGEAKLRLAQNAWSRAAAGLPARLSDAERARLAYEQAEPAFRAAGDAFRAATRADRLGTSAWQYWAQAELMGWRARGASSGLDDLVWHRIDSMLRQAMSPPRDTESLALHAQRARIAGELLAVPGWPEAERRRLLDDRLDAARAMARLNPTSASVHAALSEAAAAAGKDEEARAAARRALELDAATPHVDKKLTDRLRKLMQSRAAATT
jgi:hypothetical protein